MENKRIIVLRVRGTVGVDVKTKNTLDMLHLYKKNYCSIITNNPSFTGMLVKAKDYITWGDLDKDTFKLLLEKRARIVGDKKLTSDYLKLKTNLDFEKFSEEFMHLKKNFKDVPGIKLFFRLSPPLKGFERGGIKKPYSLGGALGYRKEKINELIRRMI